MMIIIIIIIITTIFRQDRVLRTQFRHTRDEAGEHGKASIGTRRVRWY
jgi:hypothetical protein